MHAARLAVAFVLVLGLAGCGSGKDPVMPDVTGKKLDIAQSDIKRAGFEDEVEVLGGGVFGVVMESNWEVCEQDPVAGKALTKAPRLMVDRSCEEDADVPDATPSEEPSVEPSAEPSEEQSEEPSEEPSAEPSEQAAETVTVENNQEFAALLASGRADRKVHRAFARNYRGRTIEFDGCIALMMAHGDYKTRFDVLLFPGNYKRQAKAPGPGFTFIDVNYSDFNLIGGNVPDEVRAGQNHHFVATVEGWDKAGESITLDPVSTELR